MKAAPSPARQPTFDLAALAHPAWWAALALLLVNDNLLKGRGVVPGWITGKLSDLAFVVVAPTLFAALLPRALPGRRVLALVSVIGLYVATDLSPAASDGFVAVMARLGITARLWPDWTDLVALALLPLTVHLLRLPQRRDDSRRRFTLQRVGVTVGAAACLATSAPPGYEHAPFLFNGTSTSREVRITWLLRQVPCDAEPETLQAALTASDLDDPRTLNLSSAQSAALDGPPPRDMSPAGVCAARNHTYQTAQSCVGAILETEGAAPVLMIALPYWMEYDGGAFFSCQNPPSPVSRCIPRASSPQYEPGRDAVSLREVKGQLELVVASSLSKGRLDAPPPEPNPKVRLAPIDLAAVAARPLPAVRCHELRDDYLALIDAPTCAVDLDCLSRVALPVPGGPDCQIVFNEGSAETIEEIGEKWSAACQVEPRPFCPMPPPAVCRAGRCEPR
jgi:hypothetical protein